MKCVVLIFLTLICIHVSSAWCTAYDIEKSPDGGYIIAGAVGKNYLDSHAWLIKTDQTGNVEWSKMYEGKCRSQAWSVAVLNDGYVFGGITGCYNDDAWIVKVGKDGEVEWGKVIGYGGYGDSATTVTSSYGGFVAALTISPCTTNCTNEDVWVIKFKPDGTKVWERKIDFRDYDSIKKLIRTSDGGYIGVGASGYRTNSSYRNLDIWVLKLSKNGDVEWSKFYNYSFLDVAWDVAERENTLLVVGEVWTGDLLRGAKEKQADVYALLLELDKNGNLIRHRKISCAPICAGWAVTDEGFIGVGADNRTYVWIYNTTDSTIRKIKYNIRVLPLIFGPLRSLEEGDGFILLGNSENSAWLAKYDENGHLLWERTLSSDALPVDGGGSSNSWNFYDGVYEVVLALIFSLLAMLLFIKKL
ncbi:hypothetical protein AFULGI_00023870 [Archaeoglobus fulgidus DSM 8774]|uniref:WD40 repeat protein n=1 Tax=Archaeoglobus fulgidus DSM 8774 TaxID=1344584 RepID=A0A075WIS1_ARCFL|nr:hypothetical protein [Archaeoglobus fulgidus]AIG99104.1 hypothetical protein AFULGI_00023870 [Archaeoglobus fulgidus DSM 8774]